MQSEASINIISTRRRALAAIAASVAALAVRPHAQAQEPAVTEKSSSSPNKDRTAIHYEIDFAAAPERLYEAILDQKQFAAFTGLPASIDRAPGGAFSLFGGLIEGRNVELVPNASPNPRIVQAWRPRSWTPGMYSIIHFEFKPRAAQTTLIFDHTAFPPGDYDHLDVGWRSHYWEPLKKFLA